MTINLISYPLWCLIVFTGGSQPQHCLHHEVDLQQQPQLLQIGDDCTGEDRVAQNRQQNPLQQKTSFVDEMQDETSLQHQQEEMTQHIQEQHTQQQTQQQQLQQLEDICYDKEELSSNEHMRGKSCNDNKVSI